LSAEELQPIAAETGGTITTSKKSTTLTVLPDRLLAACTGVASLPGFYHLTTITAMDTGDQIDVMYHFWKGTTFATVRTSVPKTNAKLPSLSNALPAAQLYEAEVKDLLGVVFEGNPFMKSKLLLPDEYPKDAPPPLRKEADPAKIRRMMGLE